MRSKSKICSSAILATVFTVIFGFGAIGCYRPDEGYEAVDPGELPDPIEGFDYDEAGLKPYDEPVKITVGAVDYPLEPGVAAGTTPDNQSFNRLVKKYLNIDLEYTVVGTAASNGYGAKLNLAITKGREPDMYYITDHNLFASLRSQGRLADLGSSFWYLNRELKDIYLNVVNDALKNVMAEGKLYSFPVANNTYESAQKLYIRKDWLDICGVDVPEALTMNELIALGENFVENAQKIVDDTKVACEAKQLIPLAFHNEVMGSATASASGIMQACGASPDAYFEGEDGKLYSSNTSPEMKNALSVMADMYKKGIIDKSFATKNIDMVYDDISAGKVGMVFGQWWLPNGKISETVTNIKGADWICVDLPSYNGKEALPVAKRVNIAGYNCVSSKCKHPEAAAKIINLFYEIYYNDNAEDIYGPDVKPENGFYYNMVPIKVWNATSSIAEYKRVNEVFKNAYDLGVRISYDGAGNPTSDSWRVLTSTEIDGLDGEAKIAYEAQLAEYDKLKTREKDLHWKYGYPYYCAVKSGTPIKDMSAQVKKGWGIYHCMIADDCGYDQVTRLTEGELTARYDEFYGPALTMMSEYGGYLSETLSKTVYMQIIKGEKDISAFDQYVEDYARNGGDAIVRQINLWYDAHRKLSE